MEVSFGKDNNIGTQEQSIVSELASADLNPISQRIRCGNHVNLKIILDHLGLLPAYSAALLAMGCWGWRTATTGLAPQHFVHTRISAR